MEAKAPQANCENCPFADRQVVFGFGAPPDKARAVLVGESPGFNEARLGVPFIGDSGRLLRTMLRHAGFDTPLPPKPLTLESVQAMVENEVYYTNAALCLPLRGDVETYKTSDMKIDAAMACQQRLLHELKPYFEAGVPVCTLGGASTKALTGDAGITKIRGRWHHNGRVLTTWHPAYILRQPVRAGELALDLKKLAYGRPRFDELEPIEHTLIDTPEKMIRLTEFLIQNCQNGKIKDSTVCMDIETDNVEWWHDQILCISISFKINHGYVITEEMVYTDVVRKCFTRMFDPSSCIKWVGHNFKFDLRFIKHQMHVMNAQVAYDSLIGDYVLDENRRHALKTLLNVFYDIPDYEQDLVLKYLKNRNDAYSKVPRPDLYFYAAHDTALTLLLWRDTRKHLEEEGLFERPFIYPLMASQGVFLDAELYGMMIDKGALSKLSIRLRGHLSGLYGEMVELAGLEFNPNSWKQVSRIMYGKFKMPLFKARGVKQKYSTARPIRDQIIHRYREQGMQDTNSYKWIELYSQWKQMEKLRSSYVDNLIPLIDENGRVHPDVLVYGTETGRPSVRNPALQTIPRTGTGEAVGEVWGVIIKRCFTVPKEHTLVQVDYSQAELRTAAFLSKDPFLLDVYEHDRDMHGEVAAIWYGDKYTKCTDAIKKKMLRIDAKKGIFARLYLGTEHALAGILAVTPKQAIPYLKALDDVLGGLVEWEQQQFNLMRKQGFVTTLTNRRRRFPLITRNNTDDARKAACNAPVQGMASDLTIMSLIDVDAWLKQEGHDNVHLIITVHDSIILEVPDDKVRYVATNVKRIMEATGVKWMGSVPWKADIEIGSNWGDIRPVEW